MFYGWKYNNDSIAQGVFGCWGGLNKAQTPGNNITMIYLNMDVSFGSKSAAANIAAEYQKKFDVLEQKAKAMAYHDICETFLRNRVKWEIVENPKEMRREGYYVVITGIDKMPKNHLMHLLFGIKVALVSPCHRFFEDLRKEGIKSNRKMILAMQLGYQVCPIAGGYYVESNTSGGRIFHTKFASVEDIVTLYRGNNLPGPKDESWGEEGGGYQTGPSRKLVLSSGAHSLKSEESDSRMNPNFQGLRSLKGTLQYSLYTANTPEFVKRVADLFKSIK